MWVRFHLGGCRARQAQQEYERRTAAGLAWDEQFIVGFSRPALDAKVDQSKAALDAVLAESLSGAHPADYLAAMRRRSQQC